MRTFTKFSLRFGVYLLVLAYLVADLFLFEGPLKSRLQAKDPNSPEALARAKARGVVARAFNHEITRAQLDYAINERLWREGKQLAELDENQLKLVTYAALGDLIDHEILRVKTKVNTPDLLVSDEEIDERLLRFASRFESRGEMEQSMKRQGIPDEESLRNCVAARIQQEKYIKMRVDPLVEVSEEEIRDFYETNQTALARPPLIQAHHIFRSTLNTPPDQAKQVLEEALENISSSEQDFEEAARKFSEDPKTKEKGGNLGWMSARRLPPALEKRLFELPLAQPTLVQSKIGWHLFEITAKQPARQRSIEETREEIIAGIQAKKRHQAVQDFRQALRKFENHKVQIFHDQLFPASD